MRASDIYLKEIYRIMDENPRSWLVLALLQSPFYEKLVSKDKSMYVLLEEYSDILSYYLKMDVEKEGEELYSLSILLSLLPLSRSAEKLMEFFLADIGTAYIPIEKFSLHVTHTLGVSAIALGILENLYKNNRELVENSAEVKVIDKMIMNALENDLLRHPYLKPDSFDYLTALALYSAAFHDIGYAWFNQTLFDIMQERRKVGAFLKYASCKLSDPVPSVSDGIRAIADTLTTEKSTCLLLRMPWDVHPLTSSYEILYASMPERFGVEYSLLFSFIIISVLLHTWSFSICMCERKKNELQQLNGILCEFVYDGEKKEELKRKVLGLPESDGNVDDREILNHVGRSGSEVIQEVLKAVGGENRDYLILPSVLTLADEVERDVRRLISGDMHKPHYSQSSVWLH